jgi:hypothetical protein
VSVFIFKVSVLFLQLLLISLVVYLNLTAGRSMPVTSDTNSLNSESSNGKSELTVSVREYFV